MDWINTEAFGACMAFCLALDLLATVVLVKAMVQHGRR